MGIIGFLNVQYAVKDEKVYVLEANPRSTRTIPFLAKATQRPEARIAVKVMLGAKLKDFPEEDLTSKPGEMGDERAGVPVWQIPGSEEGARTRNEINGRNDLLRRRFQRRSFQKTV
ncbi:MAG: hypothetical protein U5K69_29730 [Balneolaceae bacterium]|nr:hypothetical protein [Balneolaceae bacterium]